MMPGQGKQWCLSAKTSNISSSTGRYLLYYGKAIAAGGTSFKISIQAQDLYDAGFNPSDSIYLAGYGAAVNYNSTSDFEDAASGKRVLNAISPFWATAKTTVP